MGAEVPGGAVGWLVMNEDSSSKGSEGGGVEVEGAFKLPPAEIRGVTVDWRRRLRDGSVCGRSLSHK